MPAVFMIWAQTPWLAMEAMEMEPLYWSRFKVPSNCMPKVRLCCKSGNPVFESAVWFDFCMRIQEQVGLTRLVYLVVSVAAEI
jgi:hypothetical protein